MKNVIITIVTMLTAVAFSQNNNHSNTTTMFTIEQIKEAHSKVKSGADFPNYAQDIKKLGVASYSTFVTDGHTVFFGSYGYTTESPAKYEAMPIADKSNKQQLEKDLKVHQDGGTDYPTFCRQAADAGVEKWTVDLEQMTCTYYDKAGNSLIIEEIPEE